MPNLHEAMEKALDLLRSHDVHQPPVNVEQLAEDEGVHVVLDELEEEISGVLVVTAEGERTIGVNKLHHPNRRRFTIAHELAHLKLHPKSPTVYVDTTMLYFRGEGLHPPAQPEEVEANVFAANLLMPEAFLRSDLAKLQLDPSDEVAMRKLAQRYRVSPQALAIRLMDLGLLSGLAPNK